MLIASFSAAFAGAAAFSASDAQMKFAPLMVLAASSAEGREFV
jgi:hypothetical protein